MQSNPLKFKGVPGSPYTKKMLAYLRFRHIPYQLLIGDQAASMGMPPAKVDLLPTFYLPNAQGEIEAAVDSTPLIRRFEKEFDDRKAIPEDPVLAFLNYLIEDYGDEWLTKAMFHYRWYFDADIKMAGTILPRWSGIKSSEADLQVKSEYVAQRQISRLYVVGSNELTANVIENSYKRFLNILDDLIQKQTFIFGERPSSADFGVYAQLTQLAKFDPTPAKICLDLAPRVHAWTDIVEDLSGNDAKDSDWMNITDVKSNLSPLLNEIGKVYVPALLANAVALEKGEPEMETTIDGERWAQPTFVYQGKCLAGINQEYQNLNSSSRATVDDIFTGTGCEKLIIR
jgi:glutathione S-transferase